LFAWQLGSGSGHLVKILPLVRALSQSGSAVYLAIRDLCRGATVLNGVKGFLLQAPVRVEARPRFPGGDTFAHLLGNTGFGSLQELLAIGSAWRNLMKLIRPDLIIFEHTPIGLLASRGLPSKRVLIGTGFSCPMDSYPLPAMRSPRSK